MSPRLKSERSFSQKSGREIKFSCTLAILVPRLTGEGNTGNYSARVKLTLSTLAVHPDERKRNFRRRGMLSTDPVDMHPLWRPALPRRDRCGRGGMCGMPPRPLNAPLHRETGSHGKARFPMKTVTVSITLTLCKRSNVFLSPVSRA